MKNFKQVLSGINVYTLLNQIQQMSSVLWNTDDSWTRDKPKTTAIYDTDSIILRYNKSSQPGLMDWNKMAFTTLGSAQQIIFDLMRAVPGEHLGKVVITRLKPGQVIKDHVDMMQDGAPPYFQRYQIPLSVKPGVVFRCGDEQLYMEPGNAYWFNNQLNHSVINNSDEDRISMLTDIRPFVPLLHPIQVFGALIPGLKSEKV